MPYSVDYEVDSKVKRSDALYPKLKRTDGWFRRLAREASVKLRTRGGGGQRRFLLQSLVDDGKSFPPSSEKKGFHLSTTNHSCLILISIALNPLLPDLFTARLSLAL